MEKTTQKKKTSSKKKALVDNVITTEEGAVIINWRSIEDLANQVYYSTHRELLEGNLIFALQPISQSISLRQLVVVKNIQRGENDEIGRLSYRVGYISNGYTGYIPFTDYSYLETLLPQYMTEWGINADTIELYKQTISKFKIT